MNIAVNTNQISTQNLYLLDSKNNIIMNNGKFTKINYVHDFFTMNGIYILFPIHNFVFEQHETKKAIKFQFQHINNHVPLHDLIKLEQKILDFYSSNKCKDYKKSLLLKKKLESGLMKVYRENNIPLPNHHVKYLLKISGIWETNNEIGITYKLFECNSIK